MGLLDEAKKIKVRKRKSWDVNPEVEELAIAFIKDEVSTEQIAQVLGRSNGGSIHYFLIKALKQMYRKGRLKL